MLQSFSSAMQKRLPLLTVMEDDMEKGSVGFAVWMSCISLIANSVPVIYSKSGGK